MRISAILLSLVLTVFPAPVSFEGAVKDTAPTVKAANSQDYSQTLISSGSLLTDQQINDLIKNYGSYYKTPGMSEKDYLEAMSYQWENVTPKKDDSVRVSFDLTKRYTYRSLVSLQKNFAKYDGVSLFKIGTSTAGKAMYALEVDLTDCDPQDKHTVLLTGQVHARETAGPAYILKELTDIVNSYRDGQQTAIDALSKVRFVAVVCVNPDGHDGIGWDTDKWTYKDGQLWKATSNGTDLNRNFPGLSWMMIKKGIRQTPYRADTPDKLYYWGDSAGSCSETKAMMKFYQYYIGVEGAEILIDYHQQGRITYAGKGYAPEHNNDLSERLRKACYQTQMQGNLGKHYAYDYGDNTEDYGLNGTGSTNTDYAWAVAMGTLFSTRYGFSVYVDTTGAEYPLVMCPEYDKIPYDILKMRSPEFRTLSWEIGYGRDYLGYSKNTLKLLEKEYYDYGFDKMLYTYVSEIIER